MLRCASTLPSARARISTTSSRGAWRFGRDGFIERDQGAHDTARLQIVERIVDLVEAVTLIQQPFDGQLSFAIEDGEARHVDIWPAGASPAAADLLTGDQVVRIQRQ